MLIMIIAVVILFGAIFIFKFWSMSMMAKAIKANQPTAITVSATVAGYQPWQQQLRATGSFSAVLGTFVTNELDGLVRKVDFKDGDIIQKNALMIELNIDTEVATLHQYQAQANLYQSIYKRDLAQFAVHAISQQQVETDYAQWQVYLAQVEQENTIIAKKRIRAPFDGRLGISTVNPGDYLPAGTKIVSIQALDPIYAEFTLPQQYLPVVKVGQTINMASNVFPKQTVTGKISTIEPEIDNNTRNVSIQATVPNPKKLLLPGMFVDVILTVGSPQKYLTLPTAAISFNPYGQIVYIVRDTGKKDLKGRSILTVNQSFVQVGETRGDQIQVISGVKQGDWVVTSGQMKLKNGSQVVINNQITPSSNPNPQVRNEQL
ncbi:MAG: efflux RND transporter periplasmic adaptor subunit [Proteobacteria bacterium]|nr:efflux RND transporter periplasmic adaptor subunit [Pseudomonadota bacterium]